MRQSLPRSASLILWVLLLVLAFLIVCPLVSVFAEAVIIDGRLDLYRAWTVIAAPENLETVANSLLLGGASPCAPPFLRCPRPICWPAPKSAAASGWTLC